MTTKVLFDTDIGSDIDDAVALAYLLAQPECELLGITTVSGQALERARIASALCRAAGREVPIFPGRDAPLLVAQQQPAAQQASALPGWPHQQDFPRGEAVTFLRQQIRANPGEVVLLATGPLTNVAALFAMDDAIPGMLKGLTLMGGIFTRRSRQGGLLEWNSLLDPHAAAMVYGSPVATLRAVGLDVTEKVTMDAGEVRKRFQAPRLRPLLDFAEVWFQSRTSITFHDPLAATTIFDDAICRFARGQVAIELGSPAAAGLTHWTLRDDGPHWVAVDVTPERFFEHYFSITGMRKLRTTA